MMDLTAGTEPYSPFWPVVTFFAAFVLVGALMTWGGFVAERKKEKEQKGKDGQYYKYKPFEYMDYGMFVFTTVCTALIAMIPAGAMSQSEWAANHSTDAALVREAERVYDVELNLAEAGLLLGGMVVEVGQSVTVDGDELKVEEGVFLKLEDDILVKVDSFSPLD